MTTKTKTPARPDSWLDDFRMPAEGELEAWRRDVRAMGTLVGGCIGDAVGAPYEFRKPPRLGTAGFGRGTFGHAPGQYTDDGEQMTCVARAKSDPRLVAANLLEWFESHPKDIGNQTRAILGRVHSYQGMVAASKAYARRQELAPKPEGWHPGTGNGSLMRTGPVCLPLLGNRKAVAERARQISGLTHASPWDGDACVIWSLLVEAAVTRDGEAFDLVAAVADALEFVPPDRRQAWAALAEVALRATSPATRFGVNGSAFGCFAAALWAVARARSYEDAVHLAVSCGNDADTVTAVAGSLAGAVHGVLEIPSKWYKVWGWPGLDARGLARLALEAAAR